MNYDIQGFFPSLTNGQQELKTRSTKIFSCEIQTSQIYLQKNKINYRKLNVSLNRLNHIGNLEHFAKDRDIRVSRAITPKQIIVNNVKNNLRYFPR